ncbi:MAG: hypothetical protein AAFZ18_29295 [Myxococcota bacterium]
MTPAPRIVLASAGLLACAGLQGCGSETGRCSRLPTSPAPAPTQAGRWDQDLTFLDEALRACHPDPFRRVDVASFEARRDEVRSRLESTPDAEVPVAMAAWVAQLGDSHTLIPLGPRWTGTPVLPVRFQWFEEGLFVVAADPAREGLVGARVDAFDGLASDQASQAAARVIPHENPAWLLHQTAEHLILGHLLAGMGVLDAPDSVTLDLTQDEAPRKVKIPLGQTIASLPDRPEGPLAYRRPGELHWFHYDAEEQLLYVQYNRARERREGEFEELSREVFALADREPIARFVVDLRFNGGGNSQIFEPMLEALKSRPKLNRPEVLFVIVGRRTFSSGLLNALQLDRETRATLVGEATGGKPSHFGEVRAFSLPNSGLEVFHSTRYFDLESEAESLTPEISVRYTAADYFAGGDPALGAILGL